MKRRMSSGKAAGKSTKAAQPEAAEVIKDPKSFSPGTVKKPEPDVFPTRKRPAGLKERLRNVRI